MGGGSSYSRDVTDSSSFSSKSATSSKKAAAAFSTVGLDKGLAPAYWKKEDRVLQITQLGPIIIVVDVTGSMGEFPRVIWDKLPNFFAELLAQGYVEDPAIIFAASGDAYCDSAPVQITPPTVGSDPDETKTCDHWIKKIYIEQGGGIGSSETYELVAYYLANYVECPNAVSNNFKPIVFFICDENYYKKVHAPHIRKWIDPDYEGEDVNSLEVFKKLRQKADVFLIHKEYGGEDDTIIADWKKAVGPQNVVGLEDPKAVSDIMLGIIAGIRKVRDLDAYAADMANRGQEDSKGRMDIVLNSLAPFYKALGSNEVSIESLPTSPTAKKASGKTTRL